MDNSQEITPNVIIIIVNLQPYQFWIPSVEIAAKFSSTNRDFMNKDSPEVFDGEFSLGMPKLVQFKSKIWKLTTDCILIYYLILPRYLTCVDM